MNTLSNQSRTDALAFLKRHNTGTLATAGHDGIPHASSIHYVCDEEFNIYFLTQITSRKFKALTERPQVAFTVTTEDVPQTLQIEGRAMDISNDSSAQQKREEIFTVLNSNDYFYPPVSKLDPAVLVIVWIQPTWMRWGDYAFAKTGTEHVLREIPVEL